MNLLGTRRSAAMDNKTFDPGLIHAIFKQIWTKRAEEREKNQSIDALDAEVLPHLSRLMLTKQVGACTSKKGRSTSANANALKLSCELLQIFISEAVQRAATIAEAEGGREIEATHVERILPQLLLDF